MKEDLSDEVGILGSGSDHTAFAFYAGVPSIMYSYGKWGYPTYHTGFETFHLMDKMVDPGFRSAKNTSELRVTYIVAEHAFKQNLLWFLCLNIGRLCLGRPRAAPSWVCTWCSR